MDDKKEREVRKKINEILIKRCKFDLSVSIIGLRNLVSSLELKDFYGKVREYTIKVSLTNHVAAVSNAEE
jgi:hypothetical protein